jgi:enamine deaminase RidA (YjgF/YER057c/UK114 family)
MEMKAHDPSTIFAPVGPYAHGLEVVEARRLLFITGTMGLDKSGKAPVVAATLLEDGWLAEIEAIAAT